MKSANPLGRGLQGGPFGFWQAGQGRVKLLVGDAQRVEAQADPVEFFGGGEQRPVAPAFDIAHNRPDCGFNPLAGLLSPAEQLL